MQILLASLFWISIYHCTTQWKSSAHISLNLYTLSSQTTNESNAFVWTCLYIYCWGWTQFLTGLTPSRNRFSPQIHPCSIQAQHEQERYPDQLPIQKYIALSGSLSDPERAIEKVPTLTFLLRHPPRNSTTQAPSLLVNTPSSQSLDNVLEQSLSTVSLHAHLRAASRERDWRVDVLLLMLVGTIQLPCACCASHLPKP